MSSLKKLEEVINGKSISQAFLYIYRYFWLKIVNVIFSAYGKLILTLWGARIGKNLEVKGFLRVHLDGKLTIGNSVRIISGPQNYVGGNRRTSIWIGRNSNLFIANNCAISNSTFVCLESIKILEETYIGGGCEIYDTDFHSISAEIRRNDVNIPVGSIEIGPRAFVGGFTTILKNVKIGEGAVIGANSLVTKDVPAYEIWGGVPAKFIKKVE